MKRLPLPLLAFAGLWAYAGEPGKLDGLAAAVIVALVLGAVLALAVPLPALVPADWRKRYRRDRPRPHIRERFQRAVRRAYRHRCVYCGQRGKGEIEHIMPWSLGGLTSYWNCTILCARCNRIKSNYWVFKSGYVVYRAWDDANNRQLAAEILNRELAARRNVLRWLLVLLPW